MTDPTRPAASALPRWPSRPELLVDTTRCPACFSELTSSVCATCGLRLDVPEANLVLAAGARVHEAERDRRRLVSEMFARQAEAVRGATAPPVGAVAATPALHAAIPATTGSSLPVELPPPATPGGPPLSPPSTRMPEPATPAPSAAEPGPPTGPRRSGVQVFLLALGVVLLSVAAVVFLLVAYLIATLEVRSVIIGVASIIVLALAWLLRVRRLAGTAEGVAAVGVVLIVLDIWIVRANGLFGADRPDEAGYWGTALLVVAALLAGIRVLTGVRVPGLAAALAAPVAAFLLGFAAAPADRPATGAWLGGLAASAVGTAAVFLPARAERLIAVVAGLVGSSIATVAAVGALPDVAWGVTWAFLAAAVAWAAVAVTVRFRGRSADGGAALAGSIGAGTASALGVALGAARELDATLAMWVAPTAAGVVVVLLSLGARHGRRLARDAAAAGIAAAGIAAAALLPAIAVAVLAGVQLIGSTSIAWSVEALAERPEVATGAAFGAVLAPLGAAAASAGAIAVVPRLRRAIALPIALALFAGLAAATTAATLLAAVVLLGAVAVLALALAWWPPLRPVGGTRAVLAVAGIPAAAAAWWMSHASPALWPWLVVAAIIVAVAGRLLARGVWGPRFGPAIGSAHVVVAALLIVAAAVVLPSWAQAAGTPLAAPWSAPAFTTAAAGTAALALLLAPRWPKADRTAATIPLLSAAALGTTVLAVPTIAQAFDRLEGVPFVEDPWAWSPAAALTIVGLGWIRWDRSWARTAFAAIVPLATVLALAGAATTAGEGPRAAIGAAIGVLGAAALGLLVLPAADPVRRAWTASVSMLTLITAVAGLAPPSAPGLTWLVLLVLAPAPVLLAARFGDPIAGADPMRHLAWATPILLIGSAWSWFAGAGVDDVEAYTLPAAAVVAAVGLLLAWRRPTRSTVEPARTALAATALAVAVLPSAAMAGESELRALVLVASGGVAVLAAAFLPDHLRGVPIRLLVLLAGWAAATVAGVVRGLAMASGSAEGLPVEFWPALALAVGVVASVTSVRWRSGPSWLPDALFPSSIVIAAMPTVVAIVAGEQSTLRTALLLAALGTLHVASVAVATRPVAGAATGWTSLALMAVTAGVALPLRVLEPVGVVGPVDLVTSLIGTTLIVAGALRLRRSGDAGSWAALGPGLAIVLLPALIADWTDPELWRIVALGAIALAAVVVGVALRLQAPFALGGGVLLVHAVAQLWPWISRLYQAEWWWLWLGIAGAVLIAVAATYERQLRFARGAIRSFAALR
ncbi:SCO7613 C-terminal domain-containing membrane protein [Agromyces arachidis]|uniref:SCO7613 C-terminal domain-containing membrane protein n=1 Tax=Agromyces arachidis TaxID=766966 RepID=UPI004057A30B